MFAVIAVAAEDDGNNFFSKINEIKFCEYISKDYIEFKRTVYTQQLRTNY